MYENLFAPVVIKGAVFSMLSQSSDTSLTANKFLVSARKPNVTIPKV